jgi:hypothetical protein
LFKHLIAMYLDCFKATFIDKSYCDLFKHLIAMYLDCFKATFIDKSYCDLFKHLIAMYLDCLKRLLSIKSPQADLYVVFIYTAQVSFRLVLQFWGNVLNVIGFDMNHVYCLTFKFRKQVTLDEFINKIYCNSLLRLW